MRDPDFNNVLKILRREEPDRPTLIEFFVSTAACQRLSGYDSVPDWHSLDRLRMIAKGFLAAGYDYARVDGSAFRFTSTPVEQKASRSMNDTAVIFDRVTFDAYPWPDPDSFDYSGLDTIADELPQGAKIITCDPDGVLENVTELLGYERLCYLVVDDPQLVEDVFAEVGSRLVRYHELCSKHRGIGAMLTGDDWGFKTQTMLPPKLMRKYVFPWVKRIVEVMHAAGHPALLHSCGKIMPVMDDIIDDMRFDGKHSYEDIICPVEEMYEKYHDRIAILGGMDIDFLCRETPEAVHKRCKAMLERTSGRGGYALGSGNSIPDYVPEANYFAMLSAATGEMPSVAG